jgi:hypothetical protein
MLFTNVPLTGKLSTVTVNTLVIEPAEVVAAGTEIACVQDVKAADPIAQLQPSEVTALPVYVVFAGTVSVMLELTIDVLVFVTVKL